MVNIIYFNLNRGDDTDSLSTSSGFSSSRRSDFSDDEETQRRNPSSSVYSTIGKRFRSWVRSPLPPGSVQQEAPFGSEASNTLGPPEIIPFEDLAISLEELNNLTGDFGQNSLVGRGSYSQVFRATLNTGEVAAVKKLVICLPEEPNFDFAAKLFEVSRLQHDNVLKLLRYCLVSNNRILVHEFATMGSLHDILHGKKGMKGSEPGPVLTWKQRVKIAFGAALGLKYLHTNGIVHRAVSSSSILIFDDFVSKIADPDFSNPCTTLPWHSARAFRSRIYRPSEHAKIGRLTERDDIYRFGVVLLELLTGKKDVYPAMARNFVAWVNGLATPVLSEDKVHEGIDPKLNTDYPPKDVARLAHIAALCVQNEPESRPNMDIVVKSMQALLKFLKYEKPATLPPPPPPPPPPPSLIRID